MKMKSNNTILVLVFLSLLATAMLYQALPEQIPSHWNIKGEVDAYQNKPFVFVTGLLPLGIYLLMKFLPKIDPKRGSYEKHKKAYSITQLLVVLMMITVHWIAIFAALGFDINVGVFVRILIGLMFVIMGNYMGQIRQNYFYGIRTPWALANEEVWKKTQRAGGYTFIMMGILMMVTIVLPPSLAVIVTIVTIFGGLVFMYMYSYLTYKKTAK